MSETSLFIDSVKKRPCLYDPAHHDFKHKLQVHKQWQEVVDELGLESVYAVKQRWKNMKDSYMKYKRSQICSGKFVNNYRNWRWAKKFAFMEQYINSKPRTNYLRRARYPSSRSPDRKEILVKMQSETDFSDEEPLSIEAADVLKPCLPSPEERKDDIHHLFLSYAETFRRFSARKQVVLKGQLAALFLKAELEHLEGIGNGTSATDQEQLQACFLMG